MADLKRLTKAQLIEKIRELEAGRVGLVGRVESAISALGELGEFDQAKAELALELAGKLADPGDVPAPAAYAKQLREILAELQPPGDDDGDRSEDEIRGLSPF